MKTPPRRVDPFTFADDHECAYYASVGMSTRFITAKTGLTGGRITYRVKKFNISRMDFRNGQSTFAKIMLRNMNPIIINELNAHLKRALK